MHSRMWHGEDTCNGITCDAARQQEDGYYYCPFEALAAKSCTCTHFDNIGGRLVSDCSWKLEAFDKYGISSFVLNEDTPYDDEIWKVCLVAI